MPVVWLSVSGDYMYRKQKRKMISKNDLFQIQNWLSGMSTVMKGQWVQYWKAYTSRGPSQYIFLLQQKWQISKTFFIIYDTYIKPLWASESYVFYICYISSWIQKVVNTGIFFL